MIKPDEEKVIIENPDNGELALEGLLAKPAETTPGSNKFPGVAICHPHPLYGGSMHNNVVEELCNTLASRGIYALRFNFRGVGNSQGGFDNGRGEKKDSLAALTFLAQHDNVDQERLGILGYSFGGAIALINGVEDERIIAIGAVSPSGLPDFTKCSKPRLVISGRKDMVVPAASITEQEGEIKGNGEGSLQIIEEADHFWFGYEEEISQKIASFFEEQL